MNKPDLDEAAIAALNRFRDGPTVTERSAAITELLAKRALSRASKTDDFESGLQALARELETGEPEGRLLALAQLARIEQSSKATGPKIRKLAQLALAAPIPPARLLKEADDRFYVAKACWWVKQPWVLPYAIQAISEEVPNADAVRAELVRLAFRDAGSIAEIFAGLTDALANVKSHTESPADSLARRLAKILGALRESIHNSALLAGHDLGKQMGEMVRVPFSSVGLPTSEDARLGLAREILLCTYDLVRTRLSLLTDSNTYAGIKFARTLFVGRWPYQLEDPLFMVSEALLEAILLLGKQGIAPRPLAEQLALVSGDRETSDKRLRALADLNPELPETVRAWLRGQAPRDGAKAETLVESEHLRADPSIAEAMIEGGRLSEALLAVESDVVPALELYDPAKLATLRSLVVRATAQMAAVRELAKRRGLMLYGVSGELMPYIPKYFDAAAGSVGASVRVVRPAVVRRLDDGSPGEVVAKGMVE